MIRTSFLSFFLGFSALITANLYAGTVAEDGVSCGDLTSGNFTPREEIHRSSNDEISIYPQMVWARNSSEVSRQQLRERAESEGGIEVKQFSPRSTLGFFFEEFFYDDSAFFYFPRGVPASFITFAYRIASESGWLSVLSGQTALMTPWVDLAINPAHFNEASNWLNSQKVFLDELSLPKEARQIHQLAFLSTLPSDLRKHTNVYRYSTAESSEMPYTVVSELIKKGWIYAGSPVFVFPPPMELGF